MPVYVSTGAFKNKSLKSILQDAGKNHITHIELSAGLNYLDDVEALLKSHCNDISYLIHNYFPTPKEPFVLNLASEDSYIVGKSMDMCKRAIDMAARYKIPFYSVHSGFAFDSKGKELGNESQLKLPRISIQTAKENFIKNLAGVCKYAKEKEVKIAIENNVFAGYAKGYDDLYLGVTEADLMEIINNVPYDNLGILLDLAHAKVSCKSLKTNVIEMINMLKPYILCVHASQNDGIVDSNSKIGKNDDVYNYLKMIKPKYAVVEVYNLDICEIKQQVALVQEAIQ